MQELSILNKARVDVYLFWLMGQEGGFQWIRMWWTQFVCEGIFDIYFTSSVAEGGKKSCTVKNI